MKALTLRKAIVCGLLLAAAASLGSCGGSPSAPSAAEGVVLRGVVLGAQAASASAFSLRGAAATLTVSVLENPAITTTVAADGTFTLRGLPAGSFTLVFSSGGAELGRITFAEVAANQEITVTVRVTDSTVVLLEQQRNGIGHGDVEIEGLVAQVLSLDPSGESRFLINGKTVVARPGETAIREGNRSRSVSDVKVGRRVHVKGVWLPVQGSVQPILAREIKLQGGGDAGDDDKPAGTTCAEAGAKAEVEGKITAKGGSDITVAQQGKGDFLCEVKSATRIRKGNTSFTFGDLKVGWRVHVSGRSLGPSGGMCRVDAEEVRVQQN